MSSYTHVLSLLLPLLLLSAPATALPHTTRGRLGPTFNKRLCESCFYNTQCRSGVCRLRKCVRSATRVAIAACSQPECAPCEVRQTCKTNKCWGGKCVRNAKASKRKCFPELFASDEPLPDNRGAECDDCSSDRECESVICVRGKCTDGSIRGFKRCHGRPRCDRCKKSIQCKTAICFNGRCTGRGQRSKFRCFGRPECEQCRKNDQCVSKMCEFRAGVGKCVVEGMESKCFKSEDDGDDGDDGYDY